MRPMGKVKKAWSPHFAYAIGLIATDGCLYNDGRHINFTSKDKDLVEAFRDSLGINNKIGRKSRGREQVKKYFQIQLGDRLFHDYLQSIGIGPAKSKTLAAVIVPDEHFFHFFRGCIDGDGSITTNRHPESKHLQLRLRLASASKAFVEWVLGEVHRMAPEVKGGWISKVSKKGVYDLNFGKEDTICLFRRMYNPEPRYFLKRKYIFAKNWMGE